MKTRKNYTPLKTALIYAFFSALWILVSDEVLNFFVPHSNPNYVFAQTLKGWLFVLISGALIYFILRRDMQAQQQMQEHIEYEAGLIEDVSDAIISTDMQFHILTWNTAAERMYGWKAVEVLGHLMREFVQNEYFNISREEILKTAMEKGRWKGEVSQNHRDGRRFFVSTSLSLVKDHNGKPAGFVAVNHDMNERRQVEDALRKSEQKWASLVKTIPDYIALFDKQGNYEFLNHYAAGYSEKDVVGRHHADFISDDSRQLYVKAFEDAQRNGQTQFIDFRGYGDHGEIRDYESTFTPIFENGEFVNMLVLAHDVTERKHVDDLLRESELRFRSLIENGLDNISLLAADGTLLWESPATIRTLGYGENEFKGKNIFELVHPQDQEWVALQFSQILVQPHGAYRGTFRVQHVDGTWRWIECIGTNLLDEPSVAAIVINYRDITEKKLAEDALQLSQQQLRSMIQEAPLSIAMFDRDMRYLAASHRWVRENNNGNADFIGRSHYEIRPEIPERWREIHRKGIAGETLSSDDDFWIDQRGKKQWLRWAVVPWHDTRGEIGGIILSIEDISDRKYTEEALRASEEKYRDLVENSQNLICTHDLEGNLLSVNKAAVLLSGYSHEALLKMNLKDVMADDRAKRQFDAYITRIKADGQAQGTMKVRMANGEIRYWAFTNSLRTEGVTEPIVRGSARDITERKRAEEALRQSEQNYRDLLEHASDGIFISDSHGKYLLVNQVACDLVGYTREELLSMSLGDLAAPEDFQGQSLQLDELRDGKSILFERVFKHKNGTRIHCEISAKMLPDGRFQSLVRDITNRKQAERALGESEERFHKAFRSGPVGMSITRASDGMFIDANDAFSKIVGFDHEELVSLTSLKLNITTPEQRQEYTRQVSEAGFIYNQEMTLRHKSGELRDVLGSMEIIELNHETCVLSTAIDITERKQTAQREQKRTQALEFLAKGAPLTAVLEAIAAIVEGDSVDAICSILLLDESHEHLVIGAAAGLPEFFNEAINGSAIGIGEGSCGTAAYTGKRVIVEDIETHPYWEKYRDLARQARLRSCWSEPIFSSGGDVLGSFAVYHTQPTRPEPHELKSILSVTSLASVAIERKRAERTIREYATSLERRVEQRTAELIQANHAKDEFLANMSHELRTPLNSVLGFSEALMEGVRGPLNERQAQAVQIIYSSGEHLLELINDILDVSKVEAGKFEIHPEMVDVDEICQSSLTFIKQFAFKKSISVEYSLSPHKILMLADPKRLKQILVNLLNNAVKFTPEQGKVSLQVVGDEEKDQMRFSIIDNGIGIAKDDLPKLFQPFVQLDGSLSRQYQGSGLGLMLAQQLAEMHGGSVQVQSEVGKGSSFTLILPWKQNPDPASGAELFELEDEPKNSASSSADSIKGTGAKILLAEDNETNVMVVRDYLEVCGYQIFVARHGAEALAMADEISPDLILMDVQMPEMDGLEAIQRLRATTRFATVPIIVLTAFAMPGDRERCLAAGANDYLAKPVSLKKLDENISRLLR